MKKILITLIALGSLSAFAESPKLNCEAKVLDHAIAQLKDSDNCIENGCRTYGGSVNELSPKNYSVMVSYNYHRDGFSAKRWDESSTISVEKGCVIKP